MQNLRAKLTLATMTYKCLTMKLLLGILLTAAWPAGSALAGVILGYSSQNYFRIDTSSGAITNLGLGPPGRGDFIPGADRFAFTSSGDVYSISPGGFDFTYNPHTQRGDLYEYRTSPSLLDDLRQGPDGLVYLLGVFGDLDVVDPNTRQTVDSFTSVLADQLAITTKNDLILRDAFRIGQLDRQTGQVSYFDLHDATLRPLSASTIGYDGLGNVLFTSGARNEIYRLDPATGEVSTLPTDFSTFRVDYISPGPAGTLLVSTGDYDGAIRLVDEQTGQTQLSISRGPGFWPNFVVYTAVPEPHSLALMALAVMATTFVRHRQAWAGLQSHLNHQ